MAVPFLDTIDVTAQTAILTSYDGSSSRIGIYRNANDPNGSVAAHPGSICLVTSSGTVWRKETGAGTNTGWVLLSSSEDTNFANTNLVASQNTSHDWGGNAFSLLNLDSFNFVASFGGAFSADTLTLTSSETRIRNDSSALPGTMKFFESSTNGQHYVGIDAPDAVSESWFLTLPVSKPTAPGQVLVGDTNGNASWATQTINDPYFRGSYSDLAALNAIETAGTAPFDTLAARAGDYALLANGASAATWAYFDAGTGAFNELVPGNTPTVNLSIANRNDTTFEVVTGLGTPAEIPVVTQALAGGMSAADKVKSDNTNSHTQFYGNGSALSYTINHSLSTRALHVNVQESTGAGRQVFPTVEMTTTGSITVRHAVAPATNAYRITVTKVNQAA